MHRAVLALAALLAFAVPSPAGDGETPAAAPAEELKVEVVQKGEGTPVKDGDYVLAHMKITVAGGGAVLLDTRLEGDPQPFPVGRNSVIPALDQLARRMRIGDRWKTRAPAKLAWGEKGYPGLVPPKADIDLDVEITGVLEIRHEVIKEGKGPLPLNGQLMLVHYTGTLQDGTGFDDSRARDEPILVTYGTNQVVPGWELTLAQMRVGDRWKVVIPWQLAYGKAGNPPGIPPKADLTFDMEVLPLPEVRTLEVLQKSEGMQLMPGNSVLVHYVISLKDGTAVDQTRTAREPVRLTLGAGQVFPGFELALVRMRVGERTKFELPWVLAYGAAGRPPNVPKRADVVLDVEVLEAK